MPNAELQKVIESFDKAMKGFGVDFYLIGARARDLWLAAKNMAPQRATLDYDFAVSIQNLDQYKKLLEYLEKTGDFINDNNIPQRIYTADRKYIIDLLPFGEIENAWYVTFDDKDKTRIATLGLLEVYGKSFPFSFEGNIEILTASLAGIVILKLIAWIDRTDVRGKDMKDISFIIENYFDLQDDLIYEKHNRFFEGDREIDQIAALALGSEMKEILVASEMLNKVVLEVLNKHANLKDASSMVQIIAAEMDKDFSNVIEYIELILQGINE